MVDMLVYLPLHLDLAMHAVPAVALAVDFFIYEQKFGRKSAILAPLLAFAYAIFYGSWVEHCSSKNNGVCGWFYHAVPDIMLIIGSSPIPVPHG